MKPIKRRDFLKSSATVVGTSLISTPTILLSNNARGKKGQIYPDQRRKYRDTKSGHVVWQMTDTPGRTTHAQYFTQPGTTPDGRWLIYGSDRGCEEGQLNIFKMDLQTGISIQLTESNRNLKPRWSPMVMTLIELQTTCLGVRTTCKVSSLKLNQSHNHWRPAC